MQNGDEITLNLSRERSNLMRLTLFAMNIKTDRLTFAGNEFFIIDSCFRNWITSDCYQLASIGGKVFGREILLINPYQGKVAEILKAYRYSLYQKQLIHIKPNEQQITRLLSDISIYVSQLLQPNADAVQRIIDKHKNNPAQCLSSGQQITPYIDFEIFLDENVGVCRHYAVLCCLVAAHLMNKNNLPAGQIILERTNLLNSAHACMHYVSNNKHWVIDPTKCLNRNTAHTAVTLINPDKPPEELTPTLPISPDITPPSSQSCEPCLPCADEYEQSMQHQSYQYERLGR